MDLFSYNVFLFNTIMIMYVLLSVIRILHNVFVNKYESDLKELDCVFSWLRVQEEEVAVERSQVQDM